MRFETIENPLTRRPEQHPIETCAECGRDIDNALEGYYGHRGIKGLVLCAEDYGKKAADGTFTATGVTVRGIVYRAVAEL